MANCYVRNLYTGESATREFVERFLTNWASPDECERSLYDSIYGLSFSGLNDTYLTKSAVAKPSPNAHVPSTIGRASKLAGGRNTSEVLWCMKIDVARAVKKLDTRQRNVLSLRYVYDQTDNEIAKHYGVGRQHVSRIVSRAFDALAKYLDNDNF